MPSKCSIHHEQFRLKGLELVGEFSWHLRAGCIGASPLDDTGTYPVNFSWNPGWINGLDSGSHGKIMSPMRTLCGVSSQYSTPQLFVQSLQPLLSNAIEMKQQKVVHFGASGTVCKYCAML